jgi:ornithine cyclodeaminase
MYIPNEQMWSLTLFPSGATITCRRMNCPNWGGLAVIYLTEDDIRRVLPMSDAIVAVREAFCIYSRRETVVPRRVNVDIPKHQGQTLYMPAYVDALDMGGVKIVSVFPNNVKRGIPSVQAAMVLVDERTGEVCSILDGTYLTQLRTGAAHFGQHLRSVLNCG